MKLIIILIAIIAGVLFGTSIANYLSATEAERYTYEGIVTAIQQGEVLGDKMSKVWLDTYQMPIKINNPQLILKIGQPYSITVDGYGNLVSAIITEVK